MRGNFHKVKMLKAVQVVICFCAIVAFVISNEVIDDFVMELCVVMLIIAITGYCVVKLANKIDVREFMMHHNISDVEEAIADMNQIEANAAFHHLDFEVEEKIFFDKITKNSCK